MLALISRQRRIVQAARALATAAASPPLDVAVAPLLSWLNACGADTSGVGVSRDARLGCWGLTAVRQSQPGERLVFLPPSCLLSWDDGVNSLSPVLQRFVDAVPPERWTTRLGLVLLAECCKGEDSLFASYVTQLPAKHTGIPTFFSPAAVVALEYPPVASEIARRSRFLLSFVRDVVGPSSPAAFGGLVDANALAWATSCATSRSFRVRGASGPPSFLPLIDLCNHSFDNNCEVKALAGGGVELRAVRHVPAGAPLRLCYGLLSNDVLLLDYGFIVDGNPHDRVALQWSAPFIDFAREVAGLGGVSFGDPSHEDGASPAGVAASPWRTLILEALRLAGPAASLELLVGGDGLVDPRLLAALRCLYCADESPFAGIPAEERAPRLLAGTLPLPRPVERHALATAAAVCAVALAQWPTTLEQDVAASRGGAQAEEDVRLATAFRMNKKRLLAAAVAGLKLRMAAPPNAHASSDAPINE